MVKLSLDQFCYEVSQCHYNNWSEPHIMVHRVQSIAFQWYGVRRYVHRYIASVTGLETSIIDSSSVLHYGGYANF